MNKFTILFLTMFLALPMAMKADSAKEKKDDTRYLAGAVPEVEGKVVFSPPPSFPLYIDNNQIVYSEIILSYTFTS